MRDHLRNRDVSFFPSMPPAHRLRHTFRDRLRAVECPLELIDQIGGWSSIGSVGSSYGQGYKIKLMTCWLHKIRLSN